MSKNSSHCKGSPTVNLVVSIAYNNTVQRFNFPYTNKLYVLSMYSDEYIRNIFHFYLSDVVNVDSFGT